MKIDLLLDIAQAASDTTAPRLPLLERLLARGDPAPIEADTMTTALLALFGLARQAAPLAALTLLGEGLDPGDAYWLRADPICLQATSTRIVFAPLPPGDLSAGEARSLARALAAHLAALGHTLIVAHPRRWYLRCASARELDTSPAPTTRRVLLEDELPAGPDGPYWRRIMTEAQMLLHELDVNHAREAAGRLPANAIWLWGGGQVTQPHSPPYDAVYSDDPLALGLARWSGATALALPTNAADSIRGMNARAAVLIAPSGSSDPAATLSRWVEPLAAALANGRLESLRLLLLRPGRGVGRYLTRTHVRRWWRRSRPWFEYA
ncbi:MAG: hypothetical protein IT531_16530 [Burkholderiales bacterium]|nr:hypothetical protein [Burkholderiales bacterium]